MNRKHVGDRVELPAGYSTRPTSPADAEAVCMLRERVAAKQGHVVHCDPEQQRSIWNADNFDLATSSVVVESSDRQIIATATVGDMQDPPVYPWLVWVVDPDHSEKGLETFLIRWLEDTAQRVISRCPPDSRIGFRMISDAFDERRAKIIKESGYVEVHNFFLMQIDMIEAPPRAVLPDGFSIRQYQHPDDMDAFLEAEKETARDIWGYVEVRASLEEHRQQLETEINDPNVDPSLFYLAIHETSGRIAGLCLCYKEAMNDPDTAFVGELGVRREYRKKGLGLALLHHSFGEFWRRGRTAVSLHVDAASLTGATRLYERAGMGIKQKTTTFEKLMRDGVDLSTRMLDS